MSGELIDVVVERRRRETSGICSLWLRAADGGPLPAFAAGAHVEVHLGPGLVRHYSLASDPADLSAYRLAVLLTPASRGGARAFHQLAPGQHLFIGRPRNLFPLGGDDREVVLMAGGIGITPILAMAYSLARQETPFRLHYLTRSRPQTAFRAELAAAFPGRVTHHFSDVAGIPDAAALGRMIGAFAPGRHVYVCGPREMIAAVGDAARGLGWPEAAIGSELFTAPEDGDVSGAPVTLTLARSGQIVEVPGDRTLAAALRAAGVAVSVSCERGLCGTCVVGVLAGTPEHRDHCLTAEEKAAGTRIALCCSRACTPGLTLDL